MSISGINSSNDKSKYFNCNDHEHSKLDKPIELKKLSQSILTIKKDEEENAYFIKLVKNIIHFLINVERIFDCFTIFYVEISTLCSILNNNLSEICIILLKLIDEAKQPRYKRRRRDISSIMKKSDESNHILKQLNNIKKLSELHYNDKIFLLDQFLNALIELGPIFKNKLSLYGSQLIFIDENNNPNRKLSDPSIKENDLEEILSYYEKKNLIGNLKINDNFQLKFFTIFGCKDLLFIEINNEYSILIKSLDSVKKIKNFISLKFSNNLNLIKNMKNFIQKIEDSTKKTKSEAFKKYFPIFAQNDTLSNSILVVGTISNIKRNLEEAEYVTLNDLNNFDSEAYLNSNEYNRFFEYSLEVEMVKFIKHILMLNLTNYEIILNQENGSISRFSIDPIFESAELKNLFEFLVRSESSADLNNIEASFTSIFGSHELRALYTGLKEDSTTDFDIIMGLDNMKKMLKAVFNMIDRKNLKPNFKNYLIKIWQESVQNAITKNKLKILLFLLSELIDWEKKFVNKVCHYCKDQSDNDFELLKIFKNPSNLIKLNCDDCGIVFHVNCLIQNNLPLFEKITPVDKKVYYCKECSEKNLIFIENFELKSINVNNRILRDNSSRRTALFNQEAKDPTYILKRKIKRNHQQTIITKENNDQNDDIFFRMKKQKSTGSTSTSSC